jgi:hypothetical protein
LLAAQVGAAAVTVTLRRPPPLAVPMRTERDGASVRLLDSTGLVAEASPGSITAEPVPPVDAATAAAAAERYAGFAAHPFPRCFTCGPERAPGDGLRIFPGALPGRDGTTACAWVPAGSLPRAAGDSVAPSIVWAALDCPGGWTVDIAGRPAVLGRITARVDTLPEVGAEYVITGGLLGVEGRKAYSVTGLYDPAGALLAAAEAVWIAVDPATFG